MLSNQNINLEPIANQLLGTKVNVEVRLPTGALSFLFARHLVSRLYCHAVTAVFMNEVNSNDLTL